VLSPVVVRLRLFRNKINKKLHQFLPLAMLSFLSFCSFGGLAAYLYNAIAYLSVRLVILSAILTIAHRCGYLHRLLWYVAESELTKLVNHVPTTIGRLDHVDLWRGEFALSNVVIHSPSAGNGRKKSLWTSPVIARIGTVRVSVNAIQCLCAKWFLGEEIPIDFYAIYVGDVQVFVERRYNVYNFFLLDPNIILPDAFVRAATQAAGQFDDDDDSAEEHPDDEKTVAAEQEQLQQALLGGNHSDINNADRGDSVDVTTTTTRAAIPTKVTPSTNIAASSSSGSFSTMTTTESPLHQQHDNTTTTTTTQQQQQKAAAIVDDMLDAVRRAALAGSADTLVSHYKDRLQESLKRFERRQRVGSSNSIDDNVITKKTSQTAAAAALVETVELLKNVGANITAKTELAQRAVLPTRRPNPHVVYGRIGRLDIVDLRIFPHHHHDAASSVVANIHVPGISMKPSELCGPASSSSSSSFDGLHNNNNKPPPHHHPFAKMDDLIELVTKRVVSEMAKSDAGKFLQTAMQEMADALTERS
jgi:hypothetical protein